MSRLLSGLLNGAYLALFFAVSPWIVWSAVKRRKYRAGFSEKILGRVPRLQGGRTTVWLHAVSVGEVKLLATTVSRLQRARPDWELVISTTTAAGYNLARATYARHTVFYCPLDFSWAVKEALSRVRPKLLVLAELELWPNLVHAAQNHGCRVAIVNGRMSDRSYRGYRRLQWLIAPVLRKIDLITVPDAATAKRFGNLGAKQDAIHVTGNLKLDGAQTDREQPEIVRLRKVAHFAKDAIVFLAGSTQAPEEQMALETYQQIHAEHPKLRLVLVPRHPHRFDEVAALLDRSGLPWIRRTHLGNSETADSQSAILLVDTIGELSWWWGTATVGFVGGSFGPRGGQNMLEPAAFGVATCFGPNTQNFRETVAQLLAHDAAAVVDDRETLESFVRRAAADPNWAHELGGRAKRFVVSQQGGTEQTVRRLVQLLDSQLPPVVRAA